MDTLSLLIGIAIIGYIAYLKFYSAANTPSQIAGKIGIIFIVGALFFGYGAYKTFFYTFEDCLLDNLSGAASDRAHNSIRAACSRKYK